jgi:hypothetical protein
VSSPQVIELHSEDNLIDVKVKNTRNITFNPAGSVTAATLNLNKNKSRCMYSTSFVQRPPYLGIINSTTLEGQLNMFSWKCIARFHYAVNKGNDISH